MSNANPGAQWKTVRARYLGLPFAVRPNQKEFSLCMAPLMQEAGGKPTTILEPC